VTITPQLYFLGLLLSLFVEVFIFFSWRTKISRAPSRLFAGEFRGIQRFPCFQVLLATWNLEESGVEYWGQVYSEALKWESGRYIIVLLLTFWVISAYVWIAWLLNEVSKCIKSPTERFSWAFSLVFVVWVKCIVHVVAKHGREVFHKTISCVVVLCNRWALCRLGLGDIVAFWFSVESDTVLWTRECTVEMFIYFAGFKHQIKLKWCIFWHMNIWKFLLARLF